MPTLKYGTKNKVRTIWHLQKCMRKKENLGGQHIVVAKKIYAIPVAIDIRACTFICSQKSPFYPTFIKPATLIVISVLKQCASGGNSNL